jgi:transcriptional regulator with XRE-family HTH domain
MIRLAYERYERNISQQELADKAGLSKMTVSNIERGLRGVPETYQKIATAMDWSHPIMELFAQIRLADNE